MNVDRIRHMVRTIATLFAFLSAYAGSALAQGYAGLGTEIAGFKNPDPATEIQFPRDDGVHPDFRIEWWYVTANLTNETGDPMGIQWTLFRSALRPGADEGWNSPHIWMAHAAATTATDHAHAQKFARGGSGQAGAKADPFSAWLDDWELTASPNDPTQLILKAEGQSKHGDFSYDLQLQEFGPRVVHGANGYSVKSSDQTASHYFSRPFLRVSGTVDLNGQSHKVTGTAWLDREWSSQMLSSQQSGWDWVGLTLESGERIMAARVRQDGEFFIFGSFIEPDGTVIPLEEDDIALVPVTRDNPPRNWSVRMPSKGVDLRIRSINPDAWTGEDPFTYWEGPVAITGTHEGSGYLEMTGYR